VSASLLGEPDLGLLTPPEMARKAGQICYSVPSMPVLADADTGGGNVLNVQRYGAAVGPPGHGHAAPCSTGSHAAATPSPPLAPPRRSTIKQLISSGAKGCFIEDQNWPKRAGHMRNKEVIRMEEFAGGWGAARPAPERAGGGAGRAAMAQGGGGQGRRPGAPVRDNRNCEAARLRPPPAPRPAQPPPPPPPPPPKNAAKIYAAREAIGDADFFLVARTDARGTSAKYGVEDAITRANLYMDAGADASFVEAPRGSDELAEVGAKTRVGGLGWG
jgi:hypothetical protein